MCARAQASFPIKPSPVNSLECISPLCKFLKMQLLKLALRKPGPKLSLTCAAEDLHWCCWKTSRTKYTLAEPCAQGREGCNRGRSDLSKYAHAHSLIQQLLQFLYLFENRQLSKNLLQAMQHSALVGGTTISVHQQSSGIFREGTHAGSTSSSHQKVHQK